MSIEKLKAIPLSDADILSVIGTSVIPYGHLKYARKLEDVMRNRSVVILIPNQKSKIGHWVCVVRRGDTLSYFDSYGRMPDHKIYNVRHTYLSKLLHDSPYKLEYNEYNYQGPNTSTCGRHVIVRIIMKDNTLAQYHKFMTQFKNDDDLVAAITYMIR